MKKIGRFSIEGRKTNDKSESRSTFVYNLFQSVEVVQDEKGQKIEVEVEFSDKLHQQIITNQTIQIYSHMIHKLENNLSKILIYVLQSERLGAYLEEKPIKEYFELHYFTDRYRFKTKKKEAVMEQIEISLKEFKDAKIMVNDYKRAGNGFKIFLNPLTETEKEDLLSGNRPALEG
ncbi:hypothetical protein ACLIA0_15080 [Bacillaceae bacterium W0354]